MNIYKKVIDILDKRKFKNIKILSTVKYNTDTLFYCVWFINIDNKAKITYIVVDLDNINFDYNIKYVNDYDIDEFINNHAKHYYTPTLLNDFNANKAFDIIKLL